MTVGTTVEAETLGRAQLETKKKAQLPSKSSAERVAARPTGLDKLTAKGEGTEVASGACKDLKGQQQRASVYSEVLPRAHLDWQASRYHSHGAVESCPLLFQRQAGGMQRVVLGWKAVHSTRAHCSRQGRKQFLR